MLDKMIRLINKKRFKLFFWLEIIPIFPGSLISTLITANDMIITLDQFHLSYNQYSIHSLCKLKSKRDNTDIRRFFSIIWVKEIVMVM